MAIGYLSLCFAGLCAVVYLIGSTIPANYEKPVKPAADYNNIYRALSPKEL